MSAVETGPQAERFPRAVLLRVALLTAIWGTTWPLFPLAVQEVSVWTFRAVSMFLAGALLLLIAAGRGQSLRIERRHWPVLTLASLAFLVVWNIASTYAATLLPSGQAAVLGFTMPLWSALIGWLILGERVTRRLLLALLLGATAVGLLMMPGLRDYADAPMGFALGLLSGLGWAVGTIVLKRAQIKVPLTVMTGWLMVVAALPMAVVALASSEMEPFVPGTRSLLVIAYITLVPVCVGNLVWFSIVERVPANIAGLSSLMVPMVAMVAGALVHAEPLGPIQLLAMACSASALWLALLRPART